MIYNSIFEYLFHVFKETRCGCDQLSHNIFQNFMIGLQFLYFATNWLTHNLNTKMLP